MDLRGFRLGVVLVLGSISSHALAQLTEASSTAPQSGWLLEVDVFSMAIDRHTPGKDGVEYRSTTIGSLLFSTGLSDRLDIQFGMDIGREERIVGGGASSTNSGNGDGWFRAKWNFSGNETEGPGWALLPYLKLPLANDDLGNGSLEPGVVLIFDCPLGELTQWNANLGMDCLDDGAGGRDIPLYGSMSFTRTINDKWAAYGEFSGWIDLSDASNWSGEIGGGITYMFNPSAWLDVALYAGLTRSAPDYTPVVRMGWQF